MTGEFLESRQSYLIQFGKRVQVEHSHIKELDIAYDLPDASITPESLNSKRLFQGRGYRPSVSLLSYNTTGSDTLYVGFLPSGKSSRRPSSKGVRVYKPYRKPGTRVELVLTHRADTPIPFGLLDPFTHQAHLLTSFPRLYCKVFQSKYHFDPESIILDQEFRKGIRTEDLVEEIARYEELAPCIILCLVSQNFGRFLPKPVSPSSQIAHFLILAELVRQAGLHTS